ncbi:MAG: hydrogenase iron-sulfur subunit [Candidatus Lokiarchaeota archaeon]|nr:hydrogenase iron-sulfur subunit [Candidatus Lokiarchaeota archaeon]MBD3337921.1 hydrogenase iron-sulfur subunit [Candidatus Lokiarchaeota archaeon]
MSFEPKILGFLCNWCSYAGADLAGVSRIQYPPNIRVIRVMCSGRVDPEFLFQGFMAGIDGIIVMGCHPGDCHYLEGNYEAEQKFVMVKKFLELVNFENRISLEWVSASEGNRFAKIVTDFTNQIKEIGPSPLREDTHDENLLEKMNAMKLAATSYRMRALVGRERALVEQENVYGELIPPEKFNNIFTQAIYEEYLRSRILLSLGKDPKSVKDLAIEMNIQASEVLDHILILKGRSQVNLDKIIGNTPIYTSIVEV